LEQEYGSMVALWEAGFSSCPQPIALENEGDTIITAEIVYGVQMVEVLDLYQAGQLPRMLRWSARCPEPLLVNRICSWKFTRSEYSGWY